MLSISTTHLASMRHTWAWWNSTCSADCTSYTVYPTWMFLSMPRNAARVFSEEPGCIPCLWKVSSWRMCVARGMLRDFACTGAARGKHFRPRRPHGRRLRDTLPLLPRAFVADPESRSPGQVFYNIYSLTLVSPSSSSLASVLCPAAFKPTPPAYSLGNVDPEMPRELISSRLQLSRAENASA